MSTTRGRQVYANETVFDQADFFQTDGFTRVAGIVVSALVCKVFHQNTLQPWLFVDGTSTTDAQVVSGQVYWNEIVGALGFYSVRWRPTAIGFWRIVIDYPLGTQIVAQDYDVILRPGMEPSGLKTSFVRSDC